MSYRENKDVAIDSTYRDSLLRKLDYKQANVQQLLKLLIIQSSTPNIIKNNTRFQGTIVEVIRDRRKFTYNTFNEMEGYTKARVKIRYKVWVEGPFSLLFGPGIPIGNSTDAVKLRRFMPDFIPKDSLTDLGVGDKVWVGFNNTDDIYSGYIMDRMSDVSNQSGVLTNQAENTFNPLTQVVQEMFLFPPPKDPLEQPVFVNLNLALDNNEVRNFNASQTKDLFEKLLPHVFYKHGQESSRITSGYGLRGFTNNNPNVKKPEKKAVQAHAGVDLADGRGCWPVTAIAGGKVVVAKYTNVLSDNSKDANAVKVYHGNNLATTYGHLAFLTVKVGDNVRAGQIIGYQGLSGVPGGTAGYGMHVHLNYYLVNPNIPGDVSLANNRHLNPATLISDLRRFKIQTFEEYSSLEKNFINQLNKQIFDSYYQRAKEYDKLLADLRAQSKPSAKEKVQDASSQERPATPRAQQSIPVGGEIPGSDNYEPQTSGD